MIKKEKRYLEEPSQVLTFHHDRTKELWCGRYPERLRGRTYRFPTAEIQQCSIRQIRNFTKFVSYKDIKRLMSDLKRVCEQISVN